MNLIEQYNKNILEPLEKRIKYLENEIYRKNPSEITEWEKQMLKELNIELFNYYEKFAKYVNSI